MAGPIRDRRTRPDATPEQAELPLASRQPDGSTRHAPPGRPARRRPDPASPAPMADLFGKPGPVGADHPEPEPARDPVIAPTPDAEPVAEPERPEEPPPRGPLVGLLLRVDPQGLRPSDRADGYLYWVTDAAEADRALAEGLPMEADLLLTERAGAFALLARRAEEAEFERGPPAVLRLRRGALDGLVEPDEAGYRLAGLSR